MGGGLACACACSLTHGSCVHWVHLVPLFTFPSGLPVLMPWAQVSSTSLALTVSHLPQLQYLNLDFCAQTDDNLLHALAEHCPLLTRLQVRFPTVGAEGGGGGWRCREGQGQCRLGAHVLAWVVHASARVRSS